MKANELRIGNYISQDGEEIHGIVGLTIHKFELNQIKLEPIPLTEEWILKFGFGKEGESMYGFKYSYPMADWGFIIVPSFEEGKWFFGHELYDAPDENWNNQTLNFCFDLQYVHTLQNIFHSLTGEELICGKLDKK